jgi:hypothetical protein
MGRFPTLTLAMTAIIACCITEAKATSPLRHFRVSVLGFRMLARGVHANSQRTI